MNRNRNYYRKQRERSIKRKFAIQQFTLGTEYAEEIYDGKKGQLSKGKVHCSCSMCRTKSYDELSHRDKLQQESAKEQLHFYYSK